MMQPGDTVFVVHVLHGQIDADMDHFHLFSSKEKALEWCATDKHTHLLWEMVVDMPERRDARIQ